MREIVFLWLIVYKISHTSNFTVSTLPPSQPTIKLFILPISLCFYPPTLPPSQPTAAVVLTANVPATVEATAVPVSARAARELTARVDPAASAPRSAALDVLPSEWPCLLQTLSI